MSNSILVANGFVNGEKIEDIYPPCAHGGLLKEVCFNRRYFAKYEKSCKSVGAVQKSCEYYKECMPLEAYRNQFRE
jgi:hypothetical protein